MSSKVFISDRQALAWRGRRLEYFTVAWNALEGVLAIVAGAMAGSISLVGFGIDSFIEVASAAVLLWRISVDADEQNRERNERVALRVVGACFIALAIYITVQSVRTLLAHRAPQHSLFGIVIAAASLIAMPLLSRAKRRVAGELRSAAMRADSRQTDFCAYLSAILLFGLAANRLLGWWWADPAAALIMVPLIANEAREGLQGNACAECAAR
ncbi:MAG TPA: cation transporter [Terriglobales bacterium]|nr:cation transporter [Terriglobales bacterium]